MSQDLESVAEALVADGKGILAADETVPTLTKRFDTLGIRSTEQSRRTYREMLFSAPDASDFISGVILQDETIRQQSAGGRPLVSLLSQQGMIPGIKVDTGAKPLAGYPGRAAPVSKDERPRSGLMHVTPRCATLLTMSKLTPIRSLCFYGQRCATITSRARCNSVASLATYSDAMEDMPPRMRRLTA